MDYKIGTADGQTEGLQVLGVGKPWSINLEGMEECYILKPLVTRGFSHNVNLGISFLTRNDLKLICKEEKDALMPLRDGSASRARLVDGRCNSFVNPRSGKVWKATKEQRISSQVWRIPCEKINTNELRERPEEDVGV